MVTQPAHGPASQRSFKRWIVDHPDQVLVRLAIATFLLSVLCLISWTLVNFLWVAEDDHRQSVSISLQPSGSVEIEHPAMVLANNQPVTFTFMLRDSAQAITLTASIPPGLRQVVQAGEIPSTTLGVTLIDNEPFESIALVNTKLDDGLRSPASLVFTSTTLAVAVPINFRVEGTWGAATRAFINLAAADKSPINVLIITFVAGAGALLPSLLKQQADRNAQRREEIAKQEQRLKEQDYERRKSKAAETLRLFRAHLVKQELDEAQSKLKELEGPDLIEFVEVDLPVARSLIQLANATASTDLVALVKQTAIWPEEFAAAYLMAYRRLYNVKPNVLREAKDYIQIDNLSEALRADLQSAAQSFPEVQTLIWPLRRKLVVPDSSNPYQHEQAEDDVAALFGALNNDRRPAYWPEHTIFSKVRNSDWPQLVFGEHGCGCTAMSLALSKYAIAGGVRLSLYLPGQPTNNEISSGYARLLLDFVQTYPTHLSKLSSSDRSLLARILISGSSKGYVLSEIEAARLSGEWQSLPPSGLAPHFRDLGNTQSDLLMRTIGDESLDELTESEWPWALNHCARALGFERKQVTLVIDSASSASTWLQTFIAPRLAQWWQAGLVAIVFAPKVMLDNGFKIEDGVTQVNKLTWTPEEFETMLRYRYHSVLGNLRHIDNAFEPESLFAEMMGQSRYNPRNFVHLWNECRRELGDRARIDAATIKVVFEREDIA